MIGDVVDLGLAKILRNVAKCGSGLISGEVSDALVVGTLRIRFENCARKWLFVVRYLTSAHDWSRCFAPRGIPMIVPLMYPDPYSSGCASSTFIASLPVSNACDGVNSSIGCAWKRTRFECPYQSTRLFCHFPNFAHA